MVTPREHRRQSGHLRTTGQHQRPDFAQGDILFQTESVAIDSAQSAIDAGIGNVTFDIASGIIISLGTEITGQFSLTDAELDRITASQVFVGGSTASLANINGPINLVSDMGLVVQARTIMLTGQAALALGTGDITLTANKNITMAPGASISTVDGDLTLSADQGTTPISDNFTGIYVDGAAVRVTGAGNMTLAGRGGDYGIWEPAWSESPGRRQRARRKQRDGGRYRHRWQ